MQQKQHKVLYTQKNIDGSSSSAEVQSLLDVLNKYKQLRSETCSRITALHVLGVASSTYYRWRKRYKKEELPFSITSIQVDGGSVFMSHFEDESKQKNIDLYVLPPRSPEYNRCMERANVTARY